MSDELRAIAAEMIDAAEAGDEDRLEALREMAEELEAAPAEEGLGEPDAEVEARVQGYVDDIVRARLGKGRE